MITAVLMICALLTQALVAAGPAQADSLTGASPAAGSRLRSAPGSIRFDFDDLVMPASGSVSVSGPGGQASGGMAQTFGRSITQGLAGDLPNGTYSVSWSVRFLLGGDASGSYRFAIGPKPVPAAAKPVIPKASATTKPKATVAVTPAPRRSKAALVATSTAAPTTPAAAAVTTENTSPPATAAAPVVQSISSTGTGHLPSPVVLWGLILLLSVLAVMINRWRKGSRGGPVGDGSHRSRRAAVPAVSSTSAPGTGSLPGTRASRRTAELPIAAQTGLIRSDAEPGTRRGLRQRPAPAGEEIPSLLPHD